MERHLKKSHIEQTKQTRIACCLERLALQFEVSLLRTYRTMAKFPQVSSCEHKQWPYNFNCVYCIGRLTEVWKHPQMVDVNSNLGRQEKIYLFFLRTMLNIYNANIEQKLKEYIHNGYRESVSSALYITMAIKFDEIDALLYNWLISKKKKFPNYLI